MVATPFAQAGAVAVATYCTGEPTVAPFAGLVTFTEAKADAGAITRARTEQQKVFITLPLRIDIWAQGWRFRSPAGWHSPSTRERSGGDWLQRGVGSSRHKKGHQRGSRNHQCCLATFFGSSTWNVGGLIFPEEEPIVNWFFPLSPVDISRQKAAFIRVHSGFARPGWPWGENSAIVAVISGDGLRNGRGRVDAQRSGKGQGAAAQQ